MQGAREEKKKISYLAASALLCLHQLRKLRKFRTTLQLKSGLEQLPVRRSVAESQMIRRPLQKRLRKPLDHSMHRSTCRTARRHLHQRHHLQRRLSAQHSTEARGHRGRVDAVPRILAWLFHKSQSSTVSKSTIHSRSRSTKHTA